MIELPPAAAEELQAAVGLFSELPANGRREQVLAHQFPFTMQVAAQIHLYPDHPEAAVRAFAQLLAEVPMSRQDLATLGAQLDLADREDFRRLQDAAK